MSDVSLTLQQQITQAISQLSKAGGDSAIVQKGVEVLIQRLAGNQIILTDPKNQRQLQLDKNKLQGNLLQGQLYKANLEAKPNQTLMSFLPIKDPPLEQVLLSRLSSAQLQTLIKAVGEQLSNQTPNRPIIAQGKVTAIQGRRITLNIDTGQGQTSVSLNVPNSIKQLKVGQLLQVQLIPDKGNWKAQILPLTTKQTPTSVQHIIAAEKSTPQGIQKQVVPLLQNALNKPLENQTVKPVLNIPVKALEKLAINLPSVVTPALSKAIHSGDIKRITLQSAANNQFTLVIHQPKSTATLSLDAKSIEQIKTQLPELVKQLKSSVSPEKTAAVQGEKPGLVTQHQPVSRENAKVLQEQVHNILRRVLPAVQSPSEVIQQLEKVLNLKAIQEPQLKQQVEQLISQIKQGVPQGKQTDSESIKQIMTTPSINLTPASLIAQTNQQGMMGGLVALLQVALASRMMRNNSGAAERLTQFVSQILQAKTSATPVNSARTAADLSQLDQRGGLLKEIGKIFASHQASKMANSEQALQGQDSFYYTLPSALGNAVRDIELLIKRDPERKNENKEKSAKNSTWHLTMKLSVGDKGEMLTKARLTKDYLEIDFYTSNEAVKLLILEFMPLLKRRFEQLGIELGKTGCQLGKIPTTLQNKPYGIFEAKA